MPFYSPLRYPGGKRRLSWFVIRLLEFNRLKDVQYVEPFAGGASLALALLFEEHVSAIHINDLSRPVYAFWHSILNNTEEFCQKIEQIEISMQEWQTQRSIYESRDQAKLEDLGFAAFFLNRTNRSGIIGGGVIGGKQQAGKWLLNARFGKEELIRRIRRIGRYNDRIMLYNHEGVKFTRDIIPSLGSNTLVFFDPPYIEKGQKLYLNNYDLADHQCLEGQIGQLNQPWLVTYDYDGAVRNNLYGDYQRLAFELSYTTQSRGKGKEALFLSSDLRLPDDWNQPNMVSISKQQSPYPVFGQLEKHTIPSHLRREC